MSRSLIYSVISVLCIMQAHACDAYLDEGGYLVDGGVVVRVPDAVLQEKDIPVIQVTPATKSSSSDSDDSEG